VSFFGGVRRRAFPALLLGAVLAAAGVYEAGRLPSAIFPSVTFPLVKIIADVGEEPAARVMPTVTRPLEEAVRRVPGVQLVRSTTARGSSELTAQFAWGTDMDLAITRVRAEVERVRPTLPAAATIDVEWMNPAIFPIEGYALTSPTRSQADLLALAELTLRPALLRLPGVAQVQIQGGRRREFELLLDRQAPLGRSLSVAGVIDAIKADNQVLSAGLIERNHELYLALVSGRVDTLAGLGAIAVPVPHGVPARLSELGELRVADEVSYVRTSAGGRPAVLVNIIRQPAANTVDIAAAVTRLLRARPDLLPRDVAWTSFYDQAAFVSSSVAGTRDAILIGVGLAALVLLAFLRRLWLTVIAVAAIPLVVAVAGLALAALGRTVNLMSLAGVAAAIGLIADDAIVVIENVHRHVEEGRPAPAVSGVRELVPALAGSTLSTVVILLPFTLLGGVVGAFFKPLALTMALCLLISFVAALLLVPAAVALVRSRPPRAPGRRRVTSRMTDPRSRPSRSAVTMTTGRRLSRVSTVSEPAGTGVAMVETRVVPPAATSGRSSTRCASKRTASG
jgi:multidrug efflux pump subunit AcrB